ncbi:unnamed protein product [Ectocarpus sp. 8 AP-2014]
MVEGALATVAWSAARLVCVKSFDYIQTYRRHLKAKSNAAAARGLNSIPWNTEHEADGPPAPCPNDERKLLEELEVAASAGARDRRKIYHEIQRLGHKFDHMTRKTLSGKLVSATKNLFEYHQTHRTSLLDIAHNQALEVERSNESLVLPLRALSTRTSIIYLRVLSEGDKTPETKKKAKKECIDVIKSTLSGCAPAHLKPTCLRFLLSRNSADDMQQTEQVDDETADAFDTILEVMSSVHVLEPFEESESPLLAEGVPDIVLHALSAYCKSEPDSSRDYPDIVDALKQWKPRAERVDSLALLPLYAATNGPGWACNKGWDGDGLFEGPFSSLFGVSTSEEGRVTKIALGSNNLSGHLPPQLDKLDRLEEIALPGNKLVGEVPQELWRLPKLQVVALQDNSISVTPPDDSGFGPAPQALPEGATTGGTYEDPPRQRGGLAATVEACHSDKIYVCPGEVFMCSWKITNTGGDPFPKGTELIKAKSYNNKESFTAGDNKVMVNLLQPGKQQNVSVMQRAPDHATVGSEQWALVGVRGSLDFEGDQVKTCSRIYVQDQFDDGCEKSAGGGKSSSPPKTIGVLIR